MHSLATLQRLNNQFEVAKARRLAKAMNKPSGHAKDAEKGRRKDIVDTDYDCPDTLTGVYSAEDLRDLGVRS
jgi:hypothetical protein